MKKPRTHHAIFVIAVVGMTSNYGLLTANVSMQQPHGRIIVDAFVPSIPSTSSFSRRKMQSFTRSRRRAIGTISAATTTTTARYTPTRSSLWAIDTETEERLHNKHINKESQNKVDRDNMPVTTSLVDIPNDFEKDVKYQQLEIESSFLSHGGAFSDDRNNDDGLSNPLISFDEEHSKEKGSASQQGDHQLMEYIGLGTWITALSSFLLVNNFVGPFPAQVLASTPVKAFGLTHAISGMLFGGGIILTTLLEWLAVGSKSSEVLQFYFDKVPKLDSFVVLPALTMSILSGVGLAVDHYGSLGDSPFHVVGAISTLLMFAIWWAVTDVTTQGAAQAAIHEWAVENTNTASQTKDIPQIVEQRKISNVVSCLFVLAIYGFMVLKPGYTP